MKKRLGAANAKVIGIVVAVIAVLGLVYAFSQGGGGTSGSNDGVLKTLDIIGNEFTNTMDDFMPDLGLKQFNEKVQKVSIFSFARRFNACHCVFCIKPQIKTHGCFCRYSEFY